MGEAGKAKMPLGNAFLAKHRKDKRARDQTLIWAWRSTHHVNMGFKEPPACKLEMLRVRGRAIRFHFLFVHLPNERPWLFFHHNSLTYFTLPSSSPLTNNTGLPLSVSLSLPHTVSIANHSQFHPFSL